MNDSPIVLIGAGLVGALWALLLAKRGHTVHVYERRPDMRAAGFVGGRSINLAMSVRGWKAMRRAGIAGDIRQTGIPMYGRELHQDDGTLAFQAYGQAGQAIFSVSRGGLNRSLIEAADAYASVTFFFERKCEAVDLRAQQVTFSDAAGKHETIDYRVLFGADGAFSAVRSALMRTPKFNYSQHYLEHGYKELTIPPAPGGGFRMKKEALHIWPRGQFMLIALPNPDGSFTCTLFLPFEGEESFAKLQTRDQIRAFFQKYFPDTLNLIPDLVDNFLENPTPPLVTIRCNPWQYGGHTCLLGDASHAIVPFYGQGMNSGFEDCTILDDLVAEHGDDWPTVIRTFSDTRPTDADAIADLALRNFVEMRDSVADPEFLRRKRVEKHLHRTYGDAFLPVYSMVTFSEIPYREALAATGAQDRLFERIKTVDGWSEDPAQPAVRELVEKYLRK